MRELSLRLDNERSKYKVYCRCGHSLTIYPMEKKIKKLCSWCGHYVYINKRVEFMDKIKKLLAKDFNLEGVCQ